MAVSADASPYLGAGELELGRKDSKKAVIRRCVVHMTLFSIAELFSSLEGLTLTVSTDASHDHRLAW